MAKLKRLLVPRFWKVPKKINTWAVSPRPGPHPKFESIPLQVILRDILKVAETGKEAKTIIKKGEIFVDGRARKDHAFGVGLMDAIAIPKIKKYFRIVPTDKGLILKEISEKESKTKLCRIEDKTILKKGKVQLNFHDGRNLLVSKDIYKTGDSLLLELPEQKIAQHVKLENGSMVLIIKGKKSGKLVEVKEILVSRSKEPNRVICKLDNQSIEVLKDYVFVVGKDKPLVTVSE